MNIELDQHTPGPRGANTDGRSTTATIKALHKAQSNDFVKERTVGRLKKPIPGEKLSITLERALRKAGISIRTSVDLGRLDDTFNAAGIRGDSIAVMAKVLARAATRGLSLPPDTFSRELKKGLPPQSNNAENDDVRADDGAQLAHDNIEQERQRGGVRQQATPYTGTGSAPHSSSVRSMQALRTQADGEEDPTISAVKVAQRNPIPLTPGSLRGDRSQDPNRDDFR